MDLGMVAGEPILTAKEAINKLKDSTVVSVAFFASIIISSDTAYFACEPSAEILEYLWNTKPELHKRIRSYIMMHKEDLKPEINTFIMAVVLGSKND